MPPAHRAPADTPPLYQLTCLLFRCSHTYSSAAMYVWGWWCMCVSYGVCVGLVVAIVVHMCAHTATFVSTYHLICMLVLIPAHMRYACSYHAVRPEAATDAAACVCCYIRSTTPTSSSTDSVLKQPQYSLNTASLEPCKCLKRGLIGPYW